MSDFTPENGAPVEMLVQGTNTICVLKKIQAHYKESNTTKTIFVRSNFKVTSLQCHLLFAFVWDPVVVAVRTVFRLLFT